MQNRLTLLQTQTENIDSPYSPYNFDHSSSTILTDPLNPENDLVSFFYRLRTNLKDMAFLQTLQNFNNREHPAFQTMLNTPFAAERLGVRNLTAMKNAPHAEMTRIVTAIIDILEAKMTLSIENVIRVLRITNETAMIKNELISALITTYLIFKQYPKSAATFYSQLHWQVFESASPNDIVHITTQGSPIIISNDYSRQTVYSDIPEFLYFFFQSATSHHREDAGKFLSHSEGTYSTKSAILNSHEDLTHYAVRVFIAMEHGIEINENSRDFYSSLLRQMVLGQTTLSFPERQLSLSREKVTYLRDFQLHEKVLSTLHSAFLLLVTQNGSSNLLHSYFGVKLPHTIHFFQLRDTNEIIIESGLHAFENVINEFQLQNNAELELITLDRS